MISFGLTVSYKSKDTMSCNFSSIFFFRNLSTEYLQTAGDGLHGDAAAARIGDAVLRVDGDGECVAQSDGGQAHFNADQKVLITGRHGTGVGFRMAVGTVNRRDELHLL